jgi:hypothetical protein
MTCGNVGLDSMAGASSVGEGEPRRRCGCQKTIGLAVFPTTYPQVTALLELTSRVTATAKLLDDLLRVLGSGHSHSLNTRNNLAYWRSQLHETPSEDAAPA